MGRMEARLDATESVWFQRQLEAIDAQVYREKFPALKARSLVPTQGGIPDWARVYTWRELTHYGDAEFIANLADDLPRADASGTENTKMIKAVGSSYGYDFFELKAMAAQGISLTTEKALAARRAIETKIDTILAAGASAYGLEGLLNLTGAATFTPGTKAAGGKTWGTVAAPNATANEIVEDLMGIAAARVEATKEAFNRFVIILPIAQYNLASQMPMGANAALTPLKFARENSPFIEDIVPWYKATGAGAASTDRMVCYARTPEVLSGIVPMEFTPMAPQQKGLEFVVNNVATCGGVVVRYPVAVAYGDGI